MHSITSRYAPLPGTTPAPRALFIDRWGTLLDPPGRGWARKPSEVAFFEGAIDAVFRASCAGWKIYLLGNEDAVAHGRLPADAWQEVEQAFLRTLEEAGAPVSRCYACLDRPDGVEGRRSDSVYFLPNTGAFYHAAHEDGVDLARSWVVGDSTVELVAGWRSGCHTAAVGTGLGLTDGTFVVDPEFEGEDLGAVVEAILTHQVALRD